MKKLVMLTIINFAAFFVSTLVFHDIRILSLSSIFWAGFILTIINFLVRPLIVLITLPVNIITFGLFTLIINTWMVMFSDWLIGGMQINGFWTAFGTALIVSAFNIITQENLKDKKK